LAQGFCTGAQGGRRIGPEWQPPGRITATAAQRHTGEVRITIWVRPGSAHPAIGGERAGALIVAVSARAVDGKATEAALTSVASAFGVRRSAVTLVTGASSRTKIVEVAGGDPAVLTQLLANPGR
jgi:uncharacterized protein YggU (UPF0235/DUF167 family)